MAEQLAVLRQRELLDEAARARLRPAQALALVALSLAWRRRSMAGRVHQRSRQWSPLLPGRRRRRADPLHARCGRRRRSWAGPTTPSRCRNVDGAGFGEGDDTATPAAACHPCSVHAGRRPQLTGTARRSTLSSRRSRRSGCDGSPTSTPRRRRGHHRRSPRQSRRRGGSRRARGGRGRGSSDRRARRGRRALASRSGPIVASATASSATRSAYPESASERAPAQIDQPPDDVGRGQRNRDDLERPAVEMQTTSFDAADRGELVEQPGRDAAGGVFGGLTHPGQADRVAAVCTHRQGTGDLEGGARRQARARRQVTAHDAAEPGGRPQLADDAGDVAAPTRVARPPVRLTSRAITASGSPSLVSRTSPSARITAAGDLDRSVDGDRKAQPAGVIGVVADEVHPPRCPGRDDRRVAAHGHEYSVPDPATPRYRPP